MVITQIMILVAETSLHFIPFTLCHNSIYSNVKYNSWYKDAYSIYSQDTAQQDNDDDMVK